MLATVDPAALDHEAEAVRRMRTLKALAAIVSDAAAADAARSRLDAALRYSR